jgi:eukaryotic-like serine/threonine-protein kinase
VIQMSPARLERLDELFHSALDLSLEQRAAFLDEACVNDPELRDEIESLISAHEQSGDFIAGSAADVAALLLGAGALRGKQVAQYQVEGLLGSGGMGEVYLAIDRMGRNVALKVLAPRLVRERQHVTRFLHEARAVLALNHPNIVTVYDIGESDGIYYIASELIEGETLRTALARGGLKLGQVLEIAIQMCTALAAAHDKGVVHRDIKPENVMLRGDGYVKVLDFGIAKLTEEFRESGRTAPSSSAELRTAEGFVMGTAAYMSPDQARGVQVDARTDVWSCGAVLYEMLSGQLPFKGGSAAEVLAQVLEHEPAPLASLVKDLPAELQRIVSRALMKDPQDRYQTVTQMLSDLEALEQELEFSAKLQRLNSAGGVAAQPVHAAESGSGDASASLGAARNHRRLLVAFVIAVAAAAALAIGFLPGRSFKTADIESVAVLPFRNATGDADLDYLSDGMTESLINALARLPGLSVKARSMVFRYKGKEVDPQEVASALSVQSVVSGRMERHDDMLMLSLSVVDGRDGDQIWGERYDSTMMGLVALQNEIARDIARKFKASLSGEDERKVTQAYTSNGEAYQLYLKGRYHVQKVALPEIQTGIYYLEQATAIDPNYALAYVGLADAYRTSSAGDIPAALVVPKAKQAAQKAVQIDDGLATAHAQLGMLAIWYDWDQRAAEREFKRALELDPDNADAHIYYAHLLSNQGRHADAFTQAERARELEPFNTRINALEGQFLTHAGRTDEALIRLQATIGLDPNHLLPHVFAAAAYTEKRMFPEAIAEARKATEMTKRTMAHPLGLLGYALAKSGDETQARAILEELLRASRSRYVSPYGIALIYNALGEHDDTLTWLERGFEARDHKMNLLKVDPKWNNLHGDPHFEDLVHRIGF